MSSIDPKKPSWADEVELDAGGLPATTEYIENGLKHVTEYAFNEDGKKIKVVRTYKITKHVLPVAVVRRRKWCKFGDSKADEPGPNKKTTQIADEIFMQYINTKEEEKLQDQLFDASKNIAKCRICNGEHWSVNCPYKGTSMDVLQQKSAAADAATAAAAAAPKTGKYIPPFMKDNPKAAMGNYMRNDSAAIRIANLSESTTEDDLQDLVGKFGPINKIYLARDKNTNLCKGFAYVHFKFRKDAGTAIELLDGHGFDHLILSAEWSKPQAN